MPIANESDKSPNRTSEGDYELVYIVSGTTSEIEALGRADAKRPATYNGRPLKSVVPDLKTQSRGIFEITYTYGYSQDDKDDDDPQGEAPTLGTIQITGAGQTLHVNQCLSQTAYPAGKGQKLCDARVIGWHKDGVHGTDIHVPGSRYLLTKRFLPTAVTGDYFDALDELQGKTNSDTYTIQWGYRKTKYSVICDPGELLFVNYDAKTDITASGIGVWEFTFEMLRFKNRKDIAIGKDKSGTMITVAKKAGHEYLWVLYEQDSIDNPAKLIERPQIAFVSKVLEEAAFKAKLKF